MGSCADMANKQRREDDSRSLDADFVPVLEESEGNTEELIENT